MAGGRVLGVDPGSRLCGYGVIDASGTYVASGTIKMTLTRPLHYRLRELYDGLVAVIDKFQPSESAVEKIFFAKSVKAALSLGHARGVVLMALEQKGVMISEYSPLEIKKAVTGYGKAGKEQVQAMVKQVLNLDFQPSPDGADALAMAVCHHSRMEYQKKVEESEKVEESN